MKTLLLITAVITSLTAIVFADYRTWTDAATNRTLVAKMTDKKLDDSAAKVRTKKGKVHWLKAESLIEDDQEYIKQWIKSIDHLTVRVVGSKKGSKKLKVSVVAGTTALRVVGLQTDPYGEIERELKAGEALEFEYWAPSEYWVRAYRGEDMVEEETDKTKTGL